MILTAAGDEYRPSAEPTTILTADGEAYEPPKILAKDEFEVIEKALGINKRTRKPTRNAYRCGKLPDTVTTDAEGTETRHTHPLAQLLNEMAEKGYVRLYIEAKGLSKKATAKIKMGDLTAGRLVAVVQKRGLDAFVATIRKAQAEMEGRQE